MVVVEYLQEGLNLRFFLQLSFAHLFGDFAWIAIDAGHQRVSEGLVRAAVIHCLDDDCLTAGITAAQDNHNFIGFHNLPHFEAGRKYLLSTVRLPRDSIGYRKRERKINKLIKVLEAEKLM